jgi:hypothetical protein
MGWGARLGMLCALPACITWRAGPDPDRPTRWMWGLEARGGLARVSEELPQASDNPGTALGAQVEVAYQIAPPFAAGICLDLQLGFHDPGFYPTFAPGLLARHELPHVTLSTWASWYVGYRLIDEDSDSVAERDLQLAGPGAGLAALWRISLCGPRVVEVGPWVHQLWLHSVEDKVATAEDEDGAPVRTLSAGLMVQIVFGGLRD